MNDKLIPQTSRIVIIEEQMLSSMLLNRAFGGHRVQFVRLLWLTICFVDISVTDRVICRTCLTCMVGMPSSTSCKEVLRSILCFYYYQKYLLTTLLGFSIAGGGGRCERVREGGGENLAPLFIESKVLSLALEYHAFSI